MKEIKVCHEVLMSSMSVTKLLQNWYITVPFKSDYLIYLYISHKLK